MKIGKNVRLFCWRWSYALALLPAEWEVVKVKEKITIPPV